jgi:hypothetical protein
MVGHILARFMAAGEGVEVDRVEELGSMMVGVALARYGGGDALRLASGEQWKVESGELGEEWAEAERACGEYMERGGREALGEFGVDGSWRGGRGVERMETVAAFAWPAEDGVANLFFHGWMWRGEEAWQRYPLVGVWNVCGARVREFDDGSAVGLTASAGVDGHVRYADQHVHTSDDADLMMEVGEGMDEADRAAILAALHADRWQVGSDSARIAFDQSEGHGFSLFLCVAWDTIANRALLSLCAVLLGSGGSGVVAADLVPLLRSVDHKTASSRRLCDLVLRHLS